MKNEYVTADERGRYEAVAEFLTESERARVEELRQGYEETRRPNGYGHDLIAAIARGHRRRSAELLLAAMEHEVLAGNYGKPKVDARTSFKFSMTLSTLVRVAGEQGATAADVRNAVTSLLNRTDGLKIESLIERGVR